MLFHDWDAVKYFNATTLSKGFTTFYHSNIMSRGGFRGGRGGRPHDPSRPSLNHGSMPFEISPDLVSKADDLKKQDGPWPVSISI